MGAKMVFGLISKIEGARRYLRGLKFLTKKIRGLKIFLGKIRGLKIFALAPENTPGGYIPLKMIAP